jgi:hypothetical protein
MKLLPTSQGCWEYQAFALCSDHLIVCDDAAPLQQASAISTVVMKPYLSFFTLRTPLASFDDQESTDSAS